MSLTAFDELSGADAGLNVRAVAIGQYAVTLTSEERSRLNPRIIAAHIDAPLHDVIAVLEKGVGRGLLRRRFHVFCPEAKAGLVWLDSLVLAPESYDCDLCDHGPHQLTAEDIEVRYAEVRLSAASAPVENE